MNKRKNNDESVIFSKINLGKLPDFCETSLHVSSSSWSVIALPTFFVMAVSRGSAYRPPRNS
jgi:hypothetical protein